MDKRGLSRGRKRWEKPKIPPLDHKFRPNPKFSHIKPSVDTGPNLRTKLEQLDALRSYYRVQADEIFGRVNTIQLVELILELFKLDTQLQTQHLANNDNEIDEDEEIQRLFECQSNGNPQRQYGRGMGRRANSALDLINGIGELDDVAPDDSASCVAASIRQASNREKWPVLMLDVREEEQFSMGHLVRSHSYPSSRLSRAFNYELAIMREFKNADNKIIVLIDSDETIAPRCATTLVQRGYDNVFVLSGGLRLAQRLFRYGLVKARSEGDFDLEDALNLHDAMVNMDTAYLQEVRLMQTPTAQASRSSSRMARSISMASLR